METKTPATESSRMVMLRSEYLRSLHCRSEIMDYDPNEKFNYWTDEFPLDVALGFMIGLVFCICLFGTIRGM